MTEHKSKDDIMEEIIAKLLKTNYKQYICLSPSVAAYVVHYLGNSDGS